MAEEKKYSEIDLSKYASGFQGSDALDQAGEKKQNAENAYNTFVNAGFSSAKQGLADSVLNQYLNRDPFSYDFNADALYQQYKDKYIQQGKMAMQDTMGQAAAMTGGYGNSYAATVGNQAYQAQLQNLNDIIPELYQLAYDKYDKEGQNMLNQYSLLDTAIDNEYGMWSDKLGILKSDRDYYGQEESDLYNREYGTWNDNRTFDQTQYWNETNFNYTKEQNEIANAYQGGGGTGGNGGNGGNGGGGADTLWYATGTKDDDKNPIFRNSDGKTMSFGKGINPYTGTKHKDAKHGTFSNGYQPDNIGGKKLKNSGMTTDVTGKSQTIWECNGKYWLWNGKENRYVEVDIDD